MSCQIRLTANISDIASIRRNLFPTDDLRGSDSWLQQCEISVSPTGDIIVLAHKTRVVILTAKWNSSSSLSQFIITYTGQVQESDNITSVLCLPIVGQSQSSHVGPDWTCVMIGFESGFVRFYTENCELLMEEQIHNENIISLKCQSQHSPRPDISPDVHPEEIYIHYSSNICVLPGSQLFPTLRNCRIQLARVQAKGDLIDLTQAPLNPKKWGFQDQATINDAEVVGLNLTSTFDHLMTAAICGGFDAKYRAMPPHNNLVVAVGSKPFVGFHYALEGGVQPVLSDVAKAVASRLKSALPGWLTGNKSQVEKQVTVAMQPAEPMGCRFGICDLRRTGNKIILSPDHKLGAVSDALGRVMLVDTFRGVILRIFKGYRDAQCSFIQVPEERKSKFHLGNKVALFLVIYSPKKGTLEIFTVQQGSKVTTFTASKFSKLIYINYGLMGYATTSKSRYICQFTTVFIDSDGQMKEIMIPFHFALAERNNKRAKDIHLYKKLRALIKTGEYNLETLTAEAYNTCSELRTMEILSQTVEMLITNKSIPAKVTLKCVDYITEKFKNEPTTDTEVSNSLRTLCENLKALLSFYIYVSCAVDKTLDVENGNSVNPSGEKNLLKDTKLSLGTKELSNLQKLLDLTTLNDNKKPTELKVTFSDTKEFSVADFLSTFELNYQEGIKLKENVDETKLFKASEVLYKKYVTGCLVSFDELQGEFRKCRIFTKDLFKLLVHFWVNRLLEYNMNLEKEMNNLSSIIHVLVKSAAPDEVIVEYNSVSKFWSEVREILADSSRPFPALTAAILCRSVAQKIEFEKDLEHSPTSLEDENIEVLSQEHCQWSILIGKLEDVSLLNIILSNKPISSDCTLPVLSHDNVNVSLKYIQQKGKGSVSELVAKWLTLVGVNPESIVINDHLYKNAHKEETVRNVSVSSKETEKVQEEDPLEQVPKEKIKLVESQLVFDHLNLIKVQFPYNLEANRLLANMCWEYALAWQKDIQNLGMLEASMKCLRQISSTHIQQGLHNLLWCTHLKLLFESTCKLINKVGKLPKERLCRQDTGLADYQVTLFIEICANFLDGFLDAVQQSHNIPRPVLQYEHIWENGSMPLVELALQNGQINYNLLHLHYQLSLCLQMMTTFFIKQTKPVNNLFETSIIPVFFMDFQKQVPVNWEKSDTKLNFIRTQFLVKVISASLETVTINENNEAYTKDHVKWMAKCLCIARIWDLDIDLLKRYQVVNLYANGFDVIASELLPAINELSKLGPELLAVAGKRLSLYMASCPVLGEKYPALSPLLSEYLDTLNSGYYCAPSKLDDILILSSHILHCLEEGQPEHRLAEHLLDACSTLIDLDT